MVEELKKIQNIQAKCTNPKCSFTFSVALDNNGAGNFNCPLCNEEIALTEIYGSLINYNRAVELLNKTMKERHVTIF